MKLARLLPLLLLSAQTTNGSVVAARTAIRKLDDEASSALITTTPDFISAIESASTNATEPSTIQVAVDARIDFDDAAAQVDVEGLDLSSKYFRADCVGYDEMTKCLLERSASGGRFFFGRDQFNVAFKGFEFNGGSAPIQDNGGVFSFTGGSAVPFAASFTDCDFVDNTAPTKGGALYVNVNSNNDEASSLSVSGCTFDRNSASTYGGAIHAATFYASLNIDIVETTFSNNIAYNDNGNDIYGSTFGSSDRYGIQLTCTATATSSGVADDVSVTGGQACSATASPTAVPTRSPGWREITFDDFEDGWGNFKKYVKGSNDAARIRNKAAIPSGSAALRVRQDDGLDSAVIHRYDQDVTEFTDLRVTFLFRPQRIFRGKRFYVDYSSDGGENYARVKTYISDDGISNDEAFFFPRRQQTYNDTVVLVGTAFDLNTTRARIIFKCNAAGNRNFVYIDDVLFEGYAP